MILLFNLQFKHTLNVWKQRNNNAKQFSQENVSHNPYKFGTSATVIKVPKVRTILLIFIVALFLSSGVRNTTAHTLHTIADIISPNDWN